MIDVDTVLKVLGGIGTVLGGLGTLRERKRKAVPTDPTIKSLVEANRLLAKRLEETIQQAKTRETALEDEAHQWWLKFRALEQQKTGAAVATTEIAAATLTEKPAVP